MGLGRVGTPFVALWFPFQVVRDVRRALSPMETSALIGFWWALFLASEIGVRTSLGLQGDALVRRERRERPAVVVIRRP